MIGIRVDGNNQIGIGHVMRCLTIAEALREMQEEVIFFLADAGCEELVSSRGFKCCILKTAYDDMESEWDVLQGATAQFGIDRLLVDSYYVTDKYLERLREAVTTIYIDDIDSFPYSVDLLINYNVFAKAMDYPYGVECFDFNEITSNIKDKITSVFAGPSYAPVRKEFVENVVDIPEEVSEILITLGGSDAYNLSYKIADVLLEDTDVVLNVVCGPFNVHKKKLYELASANDRVRIYENVKDMWNLMKQCDLAVSAAGSTMCELAAVGRPAVTFSFVENQRRIAETFGLQGAAITVGHYIPTEEKRFLDSISGQVKLLQKDADKRRVIAEKAHALVDGKGAKRIAEAIVKCAGVKKI